MKIRKANSKALRHLKAWHRNYEPLAALVTIRCWLEVAAEIFKLRKSQKRTLRDVRRRRKIK